MNVMSQDRNIFVHGEKIESMQAVRPICEGEPFDVVCWTVSGKCYTMAEYSAGELATFEIERYRGEYESGWETFSFGDESWVSNALTRQRGYEKRTA